MNRERDTVAWETALPFVAEKIREVRREYLKRELEKRDESLEKLEKSDDRTARANQFIAGKSVSMRAVDLALRKYRIPALVIGSLAVMAMVLMIGLKESAISPPRPVMRSVAKLNEISLDKGGLPERKLATFEQKETGPMIARSVALSMVVKDCVAARVSMDALLARHHGYAAELTVSGQRNGARSLQASLRIPAGELAAAIEELRTLGTLETESQKGEEVTQQHSDLVARLKNSRETEQRLQTILLQRTGKMSDVLEVEQEISRVRGEIEVMEGEQKALEHRVGFATIDLQLGEEYRAQLATPSLANQLRNAIVAGFQSAADTIMAIVIFCMNYGPSALLWLALLFFPIRMVWRKSRAHIVREAA